MCVPGCQETVRLALSRRGFFEGVVAAGCGAAVASSTAQAAPLVGGREVVDLTHTMSADFPTFFGVPGIEMDKRFDFHKDGFNLYWWRIIEHAGTHLDAPIHFSENAMSAEAIPVSTLVTPLAVLDVSTKAAQNPDYLVSPDDLAAWEKEHGRMPENCCVAMHSGWARHVVDPAKFTGKDSSGVLHFPGFSLEAADWLMKERSVAGLAVDTFQGLQGALPLVAVRPMGSGECGKSGQSAPLRSNARRRVGEGEGCDWRSCKAHCAGVRCMGMAVERTFSILKPDATARNISGAINAMIEQAGLRIIAQKRVRISRDQAETFYAVHRQRPFFRELVEFMISGPVVVQVLEGENAIARYRDIMGATDPAKAAPGTIRKAHAKSIGENSVHGSDAPETAAVEIAQFFSGNEIVG